MKVECPTFAAIHLVACEDGKSLMAYAYPFDDREDGVVTMNIEDLPTSAFRLPKLWERD